MDSLATVAYFLGGLAIGGTLINTAFWLYRRQDDRDYRAHIATIAEALGTAPEHVRVETTYVFRRDDAARQLTLPGTEVVRHDA